MYQIAHTQNPTTTMIVRSDGAWIPTDSENRDYQAYLEWVTAGNTAEEWTLE